MLKRKARDVAQLGRVLSLGGKCRRFKSYHPDLVLFLQKNIMTNSYSASNYESDFSNHFSNESESES